MYGFQNVRELFDAARDAALENERMTRMLQAMEASEVMPGKGMTDRIAHGTVSDPMRRTDARIDRERLWHTRIEENERLMDYATCVLYGSDQDGKGGVCALLGIVYADILWWHYLGCETWERTGEIVYYSERRCKQIRDIAFDLVDSIGVGAAIAGVGVAEK